MALITRPAGGCEHREAKAGADVESGAVAPVGGALLPWQLKVIASQKAKIRSFLVIALSELIAGIIS